MLSRTLHTYEDRALCRLYLKCDGTRAETRFCLSAKRTSPFKSAGASVQSTAGSRGVRISGSDAGYTIFRGSVKGTGYPLHSPVSPSLPLPCVTVCHRVSTGFYKKVIRGTRLSLRWMLRLHQVLVCLCFVFWRKYVLYIRVLKDGGSVFFQIIGKHLPHYVT
jgi:hypothetical protein